MSRNFRYQGFGNLGGEVKIVEYLLFSYEQETYPTTSLDEKCIEFELQTDGNYYVELRQTHLTLKLKFVKGCGYKSHNTKDGKKEHKWEAKDEEKTAAEEEQDAPVPLATHVNNIFHSIFSKVEV